MSVWVGRNWVDCAGQNPSIHTKPCTYHIIFNAIITQATTVKLRKSSCHPRLLGSISRLSKSVSFLQKLDEFTAITFALVWRLSKCEYFPGSHAKCPYIGAFGELGGKQELTNSSFWLYKQISFPFYFDYSDKRIPTILSWERSP